MSASVYTAIERRAANQVWGAAGQYDPHIRTQTGFLYESDHWSFL